MCRPCTPRPPASATRSLAGSQIAKTAWTELHQPRRTARTSSADHGSPLRATGASQPTDGAHRCGLVRGPRHAGARQLPSQDRYRGNCQSRFCRLGLRVLRAVRVGVSKRVAVCTDCGGAASQPANQRDGGWPRAGHRTGCRAALPPPLGAVRYCSSLSGRPRWFRDPHPQQRASRVARNAPGAPWVAAIGDL